MLNHDTTTSMSTECRTGARPKHLMLCAALMGVAAVTISTAFLLKLDVTGTPAIHSRPEAIGKPLTIMELSPLTAEATCITAGDLKGKVTLINFWGPWCLYCRVEMPHLDALRKQMQHSQEFSFISVSCGPNLHREPLDELAVETADYLRAEGFAFPVHTDAHGQTRRGLAKLAELENQGINYPLTVLIDRQQIVRGFWIGSADGIEAEIRQTVEREVSGSK